jgi:hypothetical protein
MWNGSMCVPQEGGIDTGVSDAGSDASGDVPCGGCALPLVCVASSGDCVECIGTDASTCTGTDQACVASTCVGCDGPEDCTEVTASQCDVTNECVACTADAGCTHLTGTSVCDEGRGTCVACTTDTEATRCGANSCNPVTMTCTTTPRTSIRRCGSCVADSECSQADDRCVSMNFMGTARTGGYCLKQADTGCVQPFSTPTAARASLSGAAAEVYCGINEDVTTCEAVLDLIDDSICTFDTDCGVAGLDDGLCESVNFIANRCSYACSLGSACPSGAACPSMTYCGSP